MTAEPTLEQRLTAYFDEGPTRLPDVALVEVHSSIRASRQRAVEGPWRSLRMSTAIRVLAAAAAVAAVLLAGSRLLTTSTPGPGGTPEPSALSLPSAVGPLAAGRYVTDATDPVAPMAIAFDLPSGWSKTDWSISKDASVNLSFWTATETYEDPCRWSTSVVPLDLGVEALATALDAQAQRNASEPVGVTVGGRNGARLELDWPDTVDPASCDNGEYRLFSHEHDASRANTMGYHSVLWLLDVDGMTLIIDAAVRMPVATDVVAEVEAVVATMTTRLPVSGIALGACHLEVVDHHASGTALDAPFRVTLGSGMGELLGPLPEPFPDLGPALAQLDFHGEGFAEADEHGRPGVSLLGPADTSAGFATAQTVGGFSGSLVVNEPGLWHAHIAAIPGCLVHLPIEVLGAP